MPGQKLTQAVIYLTLVLCAACSKEVLVDYEQVPSDRVSIGLTPGQPGLRIPSDFTGLSFETDMLTNGTLTENNTPLTKLVKLLGPQGSIRIGGNSVDNIFWADRPRNGSLDADSLYTDDITHLFAFTRATGWGVLFGLNMAQSTPSRNASEAAYVIGAAGTGTTTFELGNAPDQFSELGLRPSGYTYAEFQTEWEAFYDDIHAAIPKATFAGPCTGGNMGWLLPFIPAEAGRILMATNHYYSMSPPAGPDVTVTRLLSPDNTLVTDITEAVAASRTAGIPFRMEESNSVDDGGKKGVSNTFASALWGLDYMFILAESGVSGVNFQGNNADYYSPVSIAKTTASAEPLFYGILCFQSGCQGRFIPLVMTDPSGLNVTAYAVLSDDGKIALTVINKNSTANADLAINAGMRLSSAGYISLASSASSLTATTGITLGGNSIKATGDFATPAYTPITQLSGDTAFITVPAASAMVISLQ